MRWVRAKNGSVRRQILQERGSAINRSEEEAARCLYGVTTCGALYEWVGN